MPYSLLCVQWFAYTIQHKILGGKYWRNNSYQKLANTQIFWRILKIVKAPKIIIVCPSITNSTPMVYG